MLWKKIEVWLPYLACFLSSFHVLASVSISTLLLLKNIPTMFTYIHSPVDGCLPCFQFWFTMNNAARSICIHDYVDVSFHISCLDSLKWNCFWNSHATLHFYQLYMKVLVSPHASFSTFGDTGLFKTGDTLLGVYLCLIVTFICVSLVTDGVKYTFVCLLVIQIPFLAKCLSNLWPVLYIELFVFFFLSFSYFLYILNKAFY